jgi:hypothetical protein
MTSPDERFRKATYEEKLKMMAVMSEVDQRRAAENIPYFCKDYCGKCPTRNGTGETSLVFCALGKSSIIRQQKGCLCAQCPISRTMSLRWDHYCIRGKATELSEAEQR